MEKKNKKVIVISGPTASGKTNLSIQMAKYFKGEIINADSVQFYQKFDIGSAKISEEEKKNVPHHLLSIIHPEGCYNIYDFQKAVRKLLTNIKIAFLVGGSGLYIKSALFDYELSYQNDCQKKDETILTINEMLQIIQKKDPNLILDTKNSRRVISAYKRLNEKTLRSQQKGKNIALFDILFIYLDIERDVLKQRIISRLDNMLKCGFIEEVLYLMKHHPLSNLNIIGYKEIKLFIEKKISLKKAKEFIIRNTLRYAKRQKTWFTNQVVDLKVINALSYDLEKKVIDLILNFLKKE
ncbi:tRNA (adenosine(37)-N6)-dimethylallyltransferase MiaA [Candidatus Phytoplasma pini]|uniref:tRNA dimethylallyltransferase n=1 Tax=Candidatus Phytoplasma pini TaxID=267362 RepID=A0A559KJA3_9MOLU|nr:tRNA (adenosine(37)-N6)-dimethylallyltransferase MiaA [Candidatus Phytoplasma pini]TVY12211.1 tRNA delta(2)-isopentenylpyrophosphate transferase [Candidatus Phytoplasma pini]